MKSLTLFYALPSVIFVVIAVLWWINRRLPKWLSILPVASCYLVCVFILTAGGCHRIAHVRLNGWEADLVDANGAPRELSIGGAPENPDQPHPAIVVRGYPYDALRLSYGGKEGLILKPGSGYDSTVMVDNGGQILPVRNGLPRLERLAKDDVIRISQAGESMLAFRFGNGATDLTPRAEMRWLGSAGVGAARHGSLPPRTLGFQLVGNDLVLEAGPDFDSKFSVGINERRIDLATGKAQISYTPGMVLNLLPPESLAGEIRIDEGVAKINSAIIWNSDQSDSPERAVRTIQLDLRETATIGGGEGDAIFVAGLPNGFLQLAGGDGDSLTVSFSKEALASIEDSENLFLDFPVRDLNFDLPKKLGFEEEFRLGKPDSPFGGTLVMTRKIATTPVSAPPETEDSNEETSGLIPTTIAEESGEDLTKTVEIKWLPNLKTRWELPNRQVAIPFFSGTNLPLFSRRNWKQAIYPLSRSTSMKSTMTSSLVYGVGPPALNRGYLLLTDSAVSIEREDKKIGVTSGDGVAIQVGDMRFLQILTPKTFDPSRGGGHPIRVSQRDRYDRIQLGEREVGERKVPFVKVDFVTPEIQSIPMRDIYLDKKQARAEDKSVSFGINEIEGLSALPHQVKFRKVSPWLNGANADVELRMFSLQIQDDYRLKKLDYGDEISTGGRERLRLQIEKMTFPWSAVTKVILAGLICTILALATTHRFSWFSLLFAVAFLTCSRVIFSLAASVNSPFNEATRSLAEMSVIFIPIVIAVVAFCYHWFAYRSVTKWLQVLQKQLTYKKVLIATILLFATRLLLLLLGFKESIDIGVRVALSIFYVPAYIVVFSAACWILFQRRKSAGKFDLPIMGKFTLVALAVLSAQAISGLLVSDLGLFLYFIPQALILALIGFGMIFENVARIGSGKSEKNDDLQTKLISGGTGLLLAVPLICISLVFLSPKTMVDSVPSLSEKLASPNDLASGSTLLRLLQFVDRDYLIGLGTDTAERIAQDHAIMENYARRGFFGEGYLKVDVINAKRNTALNDNVSAIYIFAQFGFIGAGAVLIAYVAFLIAVLPQARQNSGLLGWVASVAALSFSLISVYMIGSNYGILPFTGRNMYLLGLDSNGDIVESTLLILIVVISILIAEKTQQSNQNA